VGEGVVVHDNKPPRLPMSGSPISGWKKWGVPGLGVPDEASPCASHENAINRAGGPPDLLTVTTATQDSADHAQQAAVMPWSALLVHYDRLRAGLRTWNHD